MINLPTTTAVNRRIPKEAFYKHLPLTKVLKEKFVSDVERISVENSLTKENLNLTVDSGIKEILLLTVVLKKQEFDARVLEAIARQNQHKLVFQLAYEGNRQLALYHGKLYRTEWMDAAKLELKPKGFSLDEIWDSFVEQIALYEERVDNIGILSIDERLSLQEKILRLEKMIKKTEAAAWKEQQPKKQFEIYSRLRDYKQKLEELKDGKA